MLKMNIKCDECGLESLDIIQLACGICTEKSADVYVDETIKSIITDCVEIIEFDPEEDGNAGYGDTGCGDR